MQVIVQGCDLVLEVIFIYILLTVFHDFVKRKALLNYALIYGTTNTDD